MARMKRLRTPWGVVRGIPKSRGLNIKQRPSLHVTVCGRGYRAATLDTKEIGLAPGDGP